MKKFMLFASVFAAAVLFPVAGEGFKYRNIVSEKFVYYSYDGYKNVLENTLLMFVSPMFIPIIRFEGTTTDTESSTFIQGGLVYDAGGGIYSEFGYGVTLKQEGKISHEGRAEITKEGEKSLLNARLRVAYDTDEDLLTVAPDATARYQFFDLYAAKLRYFFGWHSDGGTSHALQLEHIATLGEGWWTSVYTTGIRDELGAVRQDPVWRWSAGASFHPQFTGSMGLTYTLCYETLAHDEWAIENTLAFDIKF